MMMIQISGRGKGGKGVVGEPSVLVCHVQRR